MRNTEEALTLSLKGAATGRRIGFMRAQNKAAELVLEECGDSAEALRLYKLIMSLEDR